MFIVGLNPGHDGNIAGLHDGRLESLLEAEKNSYPRYSPLQASPLVRAMTLIDSDVDVVALSGWYPKGLRQNLPRSLTFEITT